MSRTQLVWILLGLVALMAGCSMGAHPFDYCGPTYTCGPGGCSLCAPRAGSILCGPVGTEPPPGAAQPVPVGNIDFGQDILAPGEGNLDGQAMDDPAASGGQTVIEGPVIGEEGTVVDGPDFAAPAPAAPVPATQPKTAASSGWTAVRPLQPALPAPDNQ